MLEMRKGESSGAGTMLTRSIILIRIAHEGEVTLGVTQTRHGCPHAS